MSKAFRFTDDNGNDMADDLRGFAAIIGLEAAAPQRYSMALLLGIYGGFKSGTQNPAKIVQEIRALEGLCKPTSTKRAAPFTRERSPLRGLMHKHYLQDGMPSFVLNLQNELDANGLPLWQERVAAAEAAGELRYATAADVPDLARDAVSGSWLRRGKRQALTGEWIVFAEHEGRNYYLCLHHHQDSDAHIRSLIDACCRLEFPFLTSLLSD